MPVEVLLCVSQKEATKPYVFSLTNIKVYSFEEALYHSYNYWLESFEDFSSEEFIEWVKYTLNEKQLAKQISDLVSVENTCDRLLAFLSISDYYDRAQLAVLQVELKEWEQQLEWERLKEMGDYLIKKNEPEKAYIYYRKALSHGDNINVLNNMGICLMYLENYEEAVKYLKRAYEKDKANFDILVNYAEALIYNKDFERAFKYLKKAERDTERDIVYYLYGKLCYRSDNATEAINYFKKAIELGYNENFYYNLAKANVKLRRYKDALEAIDGIKDKNTEFYINLAHIHGAFSDYGAAVKSVEKALIVCNADSCLLWTTLAKYHRLNYELFKAEGAITKALNINSEDNNALLEYARIKKSLGKTKDYQTVLGDILKSFKKEYKKISDA